MSSQIGEKIKISIFGEGITYWRIYEPVIKELLKLNEEPIKIIALI